MSAIITIKKRMVCIKNPDVVGHPPEDAICIIDPNSC